MDKFLAIVQQAEGKEEPVAVHCMGGRERTGIMLACYLVKFCDMSAHEAIEHVRSQRQGSFQNDEQEQVVIDLEARLKTV